MPKKSAKKGKNAPKNANKNARRNTSSTSVQNSKNPRNAANYNAPQKPADKGDQQNRKTSGSVTNVPKNPKSSNKNVTQKRNAPAKPAQTNNVPKRQAPVNTAPRQPAPKNLVPPKSAPQPQTPPSAPISRKNQAAVKKAMNDRHGTKTKRKFRGGNYILYYILALIIIIVVFIILANVTLFDSKTIIVEGNSRYTADEIIAASGLTVGDNLLHINKEQAAGNIRNALVYIDSAKIKKSYPSKIVISVDEAETWFYIVQDGVNSAVSRNSRIIEHSTPRDLPIVRGFEAESLELGCYLKSKVPSKTTLPSEILDSAERVGLGNITEIDISDRFSIKLRIEDRILLELGNSSELDSKLIIAKNLVENEIGAQENVTVKLSNPNQVAVRPNNPNQNDDDNSKTSDNSGSASSSNTSASSDNSSDSVSSVSSQD